MLSTLCLDFIAILIPYHFHFYKSQQTFILTYYIRMCFSRHLLATIEVEKFVHLRCGQAISDLKILNHKHLTGDWLLQQVGLSLWFTWWIYFMLEFYLVRENTRGKCYTAAFTGQHGAKKKKQIWRNNQKAQVSLDFKILPELTCTFSLNFTLYFQKPGIRVNKM